MNSKEHKSSLSKTMEISSRSKFIIHTLFVLMSLICIAPLILIISISFSKEIDIINYGFKIIPKNIDFSAYRLIFANPNKIINAYKVTVLVTVAGTLGSLIINSMLAYPLSRQDFKYRRVISFYLFFTMLFGGGLVPYYILITKYLKMQDSIMVLIVPALVSAYYVFLLRTNFQKIPASLGESAKIDGASELRIFWQIILPLSTPVLATVGLLVGLGFWNEWFTSLLFISNPKLYPLQMLLKIMMDNLNSIKNDMMSNYSSDLANSKVTPTESMRMAMCLIAIGPIMILFPFLQKYFVQGLTVGSVKG